MKIYCKCAKKPRLYQSHTHVHTDFIKQSIYVQTQSVKYFIYDADKTIKHKKNKINWKPLFQLWYIEFHYSLVWNTRLSLYQHINRTTKDQLKPSVCFNSHLTGVYANSHLKGAYVNSYLTDVYVNSHLTGIYVNSHLRRRHLLKCEKNFHTTTGNAIICKKFQDA